jgi:hypothetical protein
MATSLRSHRVARVVTTAAVLGPLVWVVALFARDLRERPTTRAPVGVPAEAWLVAGRTLELRLERGTHPYRTLLVSARTAAPCPLSLRTCAADACVDEAFTAQGEPLLVRLPRGTRGGTVAIRVLSSCDAGVVVHATDGAPAIEAAQGFSWRLPFARARKVYHAQSGADLLSVAGLAWSGALAGLLAFSVLRACRARRPTGRPAAGVRPARP